MLRKSAPVSLNRRPGEPKNWSGHVFKENSVCEWSWTPVIEPAYWFYLQKRFFIVIYFLNEFKTTSDWHDRFFKTQGRILDRGSNLGIPHGIKKNWTSWPYTASELYRQSDRRLSAKLVPTFAGRGCCVVSPTNSHGRYSRLSRPEPLLFQVAPQLSSWGWVDPVSDPLLLRKSGGAGNRTRDLWICSQKLW
jgi:hypothetical protein